MAPATIAELLLAPDDPGRVLLTAQVAAASRSTTTLTEYFNALTSACAQEAPPFDTARYAQVYAEAAQNEHWLVVSLMTNAQREGDGATRLWSLAACCDSPSRRALLKKHAVDESRHSLAYLALLDLVFPGAVTRDFRAELEAFSPGYSMTQDPHPVEGSDYAHTPTTDDFVQMNIAEIRTTIHHLMQRHALFAHCPPENWPRAKKVLDSLMRDELDHVGYTAELLEEDASAVGGIGALYSRRLRDFNAITVAELGQLVFE